MTIIRKLDVFDERKICEHFHRFTDDERYLRFGFYITNTAIDEYVRNINWYKTFFIGSIEDGEINGIGELKLVQLTPVAHAELAITVEQAFQNKGIGSDIFRQLLTLARNRLMTTIHMKCLIDNVKARSIAKKFNANLHSDSGEINGLIELPMPDSHSFLDELLAGSFSCWHRFDELFAQPNL